MKTLNRKLALSVEVAFTASKNHTPYQLGNSNKDNETALQTNTGGKDGYQLMALSKRKSLNAFGHVAAF